MSYKTPLLLALVLAAGCSRVSSETKLNPDGSFTRTVTYSVAKPDIGAHQAASVDSAFVLPAEGNGITVTKKTDSVNSLSGRHPIGPRRGRAAE